MRGRGLMSLTLSHDTPVFYIILLMCPHGNNCLYFAHECKKILYMFVSYSSLGVNGWTDITKQCTLLKKRHFQGSDYSDTQDKHALKLLNVLVGKYGAVFVLPVWMPIWRGWGNSCVWVYGSRTRSPGQTSSTWDICHFSWSRLQAIHYRTGESSALLL